MDYLPHSNQIGTNKYLFLLTNKPTNNHMLIRGVMVHKNHGWVRYDTVVSPFCMFSIQQN